jgi:predicted DNA-binding antitoxin AbrB/MazE fold protein
MTIRAIYRRGVLKLSRRIKLKENQPVLVDIHPLIDDLPATTLAKLANRGKSFDFLSNSAEEVYTLRDGKALH